MRGFGFSALGLLRFLGCLASRLSEFPWILGFCCVPKTLHTMFRKQHTQDSTFNKGLCAKHVSDACFTSFSVNRISSSANRTSNVTPDFNWLFTSIDARTRSLLQGRRWSSPLRATISKSSRAGPTAHAGGGRTSGGEGGALT